MIEIKKNPNKNDYKIDHDELQSKILKKTLRCLQLFTEGHNIDLQDYIRKQTNSRNNYNMVEIIIELL